MYCPYVEPSTQLAPPMFMRVADVAAGVSRLRAAGVHFRNDIVTGPGGKQILVEEPAGNVVELSGPAAITRPGS